MNYTIVRSHRRTMAIQIKRDGRGGGPGPIRRHR